MKKESSVHEHRLKILSIDMCTIWTNFHNTTFKPQLYQVRRWITRANLRINLHTAYHCTMHECHATTVTNYLDIYFSKCESVSYSKTHILSPLSLRPHDVHPSLRENEGSIHCVDWTSPNGGVHFWRATWVTRQKCTLSRGQKVLGEY